MRIIRLIKKLAKHFLYQRRINGKFKFENRKNDHSICCIILAGYKEFTWDIVFKRVRQFAPKNIDICIVSSGLYSEKLSSIAEANNWSYISTKRNCVTLAQNIAINQFSDAEYIYKIDEDIFITKHFFQTLQKTYQECMSDGAYKPCLIAPLIPINGYGHLRILNKLFIKDDYSKIFEKPIYAAGPDRMIENNPLTAEYMWNIKSIDIMDSEFNSETFAYNACPIRFSIGAILFNRKIWEIMGGFKVKHGNCMGLDEVQICSLAMSHSLAIVVSENTLVGHLSFGKQNKHMEDFFRQNKQIFDI